MTNKLLLDFHGLNIKKNCINVNYESIIKKLLESTNKEPLINNETGCRTTLKLSVTEYMRSKQLPNFKMCLPRWQRMGWEGIWEHWRKKVDPGGGIATRTYV